MLAYPWIRIPQVDTRSIGNRDSAAVSAGFTPGKKSDNTHQENYSTVLFCA